MIIFETIAGSRLYGYHRANSDYDYRGVFLAPKDQLLGLIGGSSVTEKMITHNEETTDSVYYELRKFCVLALKGNPNILEILFSQLPTITTDLWKPFYDNRYAFLSEQLRNPYKGFLISELKSLAQNYEPKAAANAWRLAFQCGQLLSGDFNPTLPDDMQQHMRKIREDGIDRDNLLRDLHTARYSIESLPTRLPEKPNTKLISDLCIQAYERYYAHVD